MIAIGCLALGILPLVGLVAGALIAGPQGRRWGAAAGLIVAIAIGGALSYALVKVARRD